MHTINKNMVIGFLFVSILGTLWHFLYEWTGNNLVIGWFAPINESTFEHMKLLFFPGLLYLPIGTHFLKNPYPDIRNALSNGILMGTVFLPIFFYTYSGILGRTYMVIDIASFYAGTFLTFFSTYRLLKNNQKRSSNGYYLLFVFLLLFLFFTYRNPGIGIFSVK